MRRPNFKFSWGSILPLYSLSVTLFLQLDPIMRIFSWTIANKYKILIAKIMFGTATGLFTGKLLELRLDPVKMWFWNCHPHLRIIFSIFINLWLRRVFLLWMRHEWVTLDWPQWWVIAGKREKFPSFCGCLWMVTCRPTWKWEFFYFFYSQSRGRINSVHDAENKKKLKN